jgi:3'-5' exonuclease
MSRVVFDIETSGVPFESLDERQRDYLMKFAHTPEEQEEEKLKINLWPYTAEVVCIGLLNVESLKSRVFIQAPPGTPPWRSENGMVDYIPGSEEDILRWFWEDIVKFHQLISFNGRSFDGPFLHVRSAMLGIPAKRNLMPYRYDASSHCDLLEQFSFYKSFRKFSLDFICVSFGIDSPKRHGITGLDVNALHREGRFRDIAEYNHGDLVATRELFLRWKEFMNVEKEGHSSR